MNILNTWDNFLAIGVGSYIVALLLLVATMISVKKKHTIFGAIVALLCGFFGDFAKIALKIGIVLIVVRTLLIFI